MVAPFCIQTANVETGAKTLIITVYWKKKSHKQDILPKKSSNQSIVLCILWKHAMNNIILSLWGFLCIRDAWCRDNKITGCTCIRGIQYYWLKNNPYFCVFKYLRTVKQKVWSKAKKCGVALFTCVRLLCYAKKSDCFGVFWGDPPLDLNLELYSHVTMPIWLCCF